MAPGLKSGLISATASRIRCLFDEVVIGGLVVGVLGPHLAFALSHVIRLGRVVVLDQIDQGDRLGCGELQRLDDVLPRVPSLR